MKKQPSSQVLAANVRALLDTHKTINTQIHGLTTIRDWILFNPSMDI